MCNRYRLPRSARQAIAARFGIRIEDVPDYADEVPRIDEAECTPASMQFVVCQKNGERDMVRMRWGFNMAFQGRKRTVFNTRSESVMTSPLWRKRFLENRCIVPASCFLERSNDVKTAIGIKGQEIIGFAGLWGMWTNPRLNVIEPTFSIFTTEPNPVMARIHDRQPVIVDPREYDEWLAPSMRPPAHLLRAFPEELTVVTPLEQVTASLFD